MLKMARMFIHAIKGPKKMGVIVLWFVVVEDRVEQILLRMFVYVDWG